MHIALDARLILPEMTGIGRYLVGLLQGLQALPPEALSGIECQAWLQKDLPAQHPAWKLGAPHIAIKQLPIKHMDPRAQWVLPAQIRRNRIDLLHYPHFDLPWLVPGEVVVTIHDLKYLSRPDFFPQQARIKHLLMHLMVRFSLARARTVIAVSQFTRDDLVHRYRVDPQKVRVIYEGTSPHFFQRCSSEQLLQVRRRLGLADDFLLCVAERRPHKNLVGLIYTFHLLQQMGDGPAQLVIAGKPYAGYQEPQALVERLGMGCQVRCLDAVSDSDLAALYQAAGCFILLSHYEGFGLPVLEAMASGTPVVAANQTALAEIVGNAGLLVSTSDHASLDQPPSRETLALAAEAVRSVLPGAPLRDEMVRAGLERARQYTWERCAMQTLQVYREAC